MLSTWIPYVAAQIEPPPLEVNPFLAWAVGGLLAAVVALFWHNQRIHEKYKEEVEQLHRRYQERIDNQAKGFADKIEVLSNGISEFGKIVAEPIKELDSDVKSMAVSLNIKQEMRELVRQANEAKSGKRDRSDF